MNKLDNKFIKLFVNLPVILIILYFIPILGIILLIFRNFISNKKVSTYITLIIIALILLIPLGLNNILKLINFNSDNIPYLNNIIDSNFYNINLVKYSKLLLTVGIILGIVLYTIDLISNKLGLFVGNYIKNEELKDREISAKNDLIMKEKQEKAKNTHVVNCPYCGADNMLTEKNGVCKFCRRNIE